MIDKVFEVEIEKPFGNLYRKATTLVVVKDESGKYVFGTKAGYYPEGITRLMGGGVHEGEEPVDAVVREMKEEMGLHVPTSDLISLGKVNVVAKTPEKTYEHAIHVYFFKTGAHKMTAGDDVSYFVYLDEKGIEDLISNYAKIPPDVRQTANGEDFSWSDYGKVYGPIHKLVFDEVYRLNLE